MSKSRTRTLEPEPTIPALETQDTLTPVTTTEGFNVPLKDTSTHVVKEGIKPATSCSEVDRSTAAPQPPNQPAVVCEVPGDEGPCALMSHAAAEP